MSVVTKETPNSRKLDAQSGAIGYIAWGSSDITAIRTQILADAPTSYGGFPRVEPTIEEINVDDTGAPTLWAVTVPYGGRSKLVIPATGTTIWSGDTSGGTQHITNSRDFTAYGADTTPEDLGGAIGATKDGVAGVDIVGQAYNFQGTKYIADGSFDTTFRRALFQLTGKINASPVTLNGDSFAAGEVLFLGATWAQRQTVHPLDWEVNFKFAARPNLSGGDVQPVGAITIDAIGGWDYLDVIYEDTTSGDGSALIKTPNYAIVHTVYPSGDFSLLGLS